MTEFQEALDEGMEAIEDLDCETVQLSIAPGIDVDANVGEFRRQRAMQGTGYEWIETGTILIRRSALCAVGIVGVCPDSGQQIIARGKTYRIQFARPDSTSFSLDCINVS